MGLRHALSRLGSDHQFEMVHTTLDCFAKLRNSIIREQIHEVARARTGVWPIPDCLLKDLGREPVAGLAVVRHALWLSHEQSTI